jgi:hypothetical protein
MINFFKAIQAYFDATPHNTFYTALGGRFEYGESDQQGAGGARPYAVYFGLPFITADTFSEDTDEGSFQINIYSDNSSSGESMTLLGLCKDLFDGVVLSPTGYRDVRLVKEMETPAWKSGEDWVTSIEFSILLQED